MQNVDLVFQSNKQVPGKLRPVIKPPWLVYTPPTKVIDLSSILSMINYFHFIHERYPSHHPICFNLADVQFYDKLTVALFECFCYALIQEYGYNIRISGTPKHDITTECLLCSPLLLLSSNKSNYLERFCDHFDSDIYLNHFRKVLPQSVASDGTLGILSTDMENFMKNVGIPEVYRQSVSDAIQELVRNASEHGLSDCLIDLDVTGSYVKKEDDGYTYRGINLALISFSRTLFGDAMKAKLSMQSYDESDPRYEYVQRALSNHRKYFNPRYTEEDFYLISAFQHKITSRPDTTKSGGTGLTKLIRTLEDLAEAHSCYMISGKRKIAFPRALLEYDKEEFIGFNREQTFLTAPPDPEVIRTSKLYIPGTAYNLNLIVKEI